MNEFEDECSFSRLIEEIISRATRPDQEAQFLAGVNYRPGRITDDRSVEKLVRNLGDMLKNDGRSLTGCYSPAIVNYAGDGNQPCSIQQNESQNVDYGRQASIASTQQQQNGTYPSNEYHQTCDSQQVSDGQHALIQPWTEALKISVFKSDGTHVLTTLVGWEMETRHIAPTFQSLFAQSLKGG